MGYFNTLTIHINCPNCNNTVEQRIQFNYGSTFLLEYKIGDHLKWGTNDIGIPNRKHVKAYAMAESTECPVCGYNGLVEEYDVIIESDIIKSVNKMDSIDPYLDNGGDYVVIE